MLFSSFVGATTTATVAALQRRLVGANASSEIVRIFHEETETEFEKPRMSLPHPDEVSDPIAAISP